MRDDNVNPTYKGYRNNYDDEDYESGDKGNKFNTVKNLQGLPGISGIQRVSGINLPGRQDNQDMGSNTLNYKYNQQDILNNKMNAINKDGLSLGKYLIIKVRNLKNLANDGKRALKSDNNYIYNSSNAKYSTKSGERHHSSDKLKHTSKKELKEVNSGTGTDTGIGTGLAGASSETGPYGKVYKNDYVNNLHCTLKKKEENDLAKLYEKFFIKDEDQKKIEDNSKNTPGLGSNLNKNALELGTEKDRPPSAQTSKTGKSRESSKTRKNNTGVSEKNNNNDINKLLNFNKKGLNRNKIDLVDKNEILSIIGNKINSDNVSFNKSIPTKHSRSNISNINTNSNNTNKTSEKIQIYNKYNYSHDSDDSENEKPKSIKDNTNSNKAYTSSFSKAEEEESTSYTSNKRSSSKNNYAYSSTSCASDKLIGLGNLGNTCFMYLKS